jgi:hypothetical protein
MSSLTPPLQCVGQYIYFVPVCLEKMVRIIFPLSDVICSCITVLDYLLFWHNEFYKIHTEMDILDQ